jgi:hypothetical protein
VNRGDTTIQRLEPYLMQEYLTERHQNSDLGSYIKMSDSICTNGVCQKTG